MWIALFLYEMAMNFLIRFVDIESRRIELDLGRVLLFMLIGAPTIGAVWAVVTFVVMYPLRAIRGDGWMALLAYLWVWAIFCLLTFGLAFSASR